MPKSSKELFCFFSGFSHLVIELLDYHCNFERGTVLLACENQGEHELSEGEYIQLNGVLFIVIETSGSHFKASSTRELINNTSIDRTRVGEKLTLGILAEKDLVHDHMWMLQPSALDEVTYCGYSLLEAHEHTLKLDFEAPIGMEPLIQENCHLGLAGSSLTVRQVILDSHLIKFSIYCGRETREQSQFNQDLIPGTRVNITAPAEIETRFGL